MIQKEDRGKKVKSRSWRGVLILINSPAAFRSLCYRNQVAAYTYAVRAILSVRPPASFSQACGARCWQVPSTPQPSLGGFAKSDYSSDAECAN